MASRVIFIHTPCPQIEEDNLEPPLGLLQMASVLRQNGHHVEILDLCSNTLKKCYQSLNKTSDFNYLCFSTYTSTYHLTKKLVRHIKTEKNITVAGGPHATALSEEVSHDFDHVICGEGENGMLELLNGNKDKIIHSKPVINLDLLPFPAYDLVDLKRYTRTVNGNKSLSILSSRGCPYHCVFCNSTIFSKNNFRTRSPGHVATEINTLTSKYGIKNFRFQDDLFSINPDRIKEIFKLIKVPITYRCFARADTLSEEMCKVLSETGCKHVSIGVESGSDTILQRMNKGITTKDIRSGIVNAKNAGLSVRIYLIVGFPGENEETIKETMTLLESMPFDEFVVYPLIPYPGTRMFYKPLEFGITWIDKDYKKYIQVGKNRYAGFVFKTDEIDEKTLRNWRSRMINNLENRLNKRWSSTKSKFK